MSFFFALNETAPWCWVGRPFQGVFLACFAQVHPSKEAVKLRDHLFSGPRPRLWVLPAKKRQCIRTAPGPSGIALQTNPPECIILDPACPFEPSEVHQHFAADMDVIAPWAALKVGVVHKVRFVRMIVQAPQELGHASAAPRALVAAEVAQRKNNVQEGQPYLPGNVGAGAICGTLPPTFVMLTDTQGLVHSGTYLGNNFRYAWCSNFCFPRRGGPWSHLPGTPPPPKKKDLLKSLRFRQSVIRLQRCSLNSCACHLNMSMLFCS